MWLNILFWQKPKALIQVACPAQLYAVSGANCISMFVHENNGKVSSISKLRPSIPFFHDFCNIQSCCQGQGFGWVSSKPLKTCEAMSFNKMKTFGKFMTTVTRASFYFYFFFYYFLLKKAQTHLILGSIGFLFLVSLCFWQVKAICF